MTLSRVISAFTCICALLLPSLLAAGVPFPTPLPYQSIALAPLNPELLKNPWEAWSRQKQAELDALMRWADQQPLVVSINEVMINSSDYNEEKGEYIELYNACCYPIDISGWTVGDSEQTDTLEDYYTGGLDTPGLCIPPWGYALIVDPDMGNLYTTLIANNTDPEDLIVVTVADDAIGNGLSNLGEKITITTTATYYQSTVKKKLELQCPAQNYNGKSYHFSGGAWKVNGTPSPGFANY